MPAVDSVFSRSRAFSTAVFGDEFTAGLRSLARYVAEHGGLPGPGYRSPDGSRPGAWLDGVRRCPHVYSERERASLLAVPGVRLAIRPSPLAPSYSDADAAVLWERIRAWAVPEKEAVSA